MWIRKLTLACAVYPVGQKYMKQQHLLQITVSCLPAHPLLTKMDYTQQQPYPRSAVWKPRSSYLLPTGLSLAEYSDFPRTRHSFNRDTRYMADDSVKTGGRDTELMEISCLFLLFAYVGWMKVFRLSLACWCHSLTISSCSLPAQSGFCHRRKASGEWHKFWHPFRRMFKTFCLLSPEDPNTRLRKDGLGNEGRVWMWVWLEF